MIHMHLNLVVLYEPRRSSLQVRLQTWKAMGQTETLTPLFLNQPQLPRLFKVLQAQVQNST